jgi:hypothetical protein
MKRQLLLFTFLFVSITIFAQRTGDATFYSNTGKKFYVVLNGIRQNTEAQTNVNITGLSEPYYSCRIIAEDKSFNFDKNIIVKTDSIVTYRIIEKKGKYKMRFYSEASLGTAPVPADRVDVVYHDTDTPQNSTSVSNNGGSSSAVSTNTAGSGTNVNGSTNTSTNVSTSTTTTSTSTNQGGNAENISIDINLTENGMGANINIQGTGTSKGDGSGGGTGGGSGNGTGPGNGLGMSNNGTTSTSTETTTTTTSTTTTMNGTTTHSEESTTVTTSSDNGFSTSSEETTNAGSEGNIYTDDQMTMTMGTGCGTSEQDIQNFTTQIDSEDFSEGKLEFALKVAKEKCMTVEQIRAISNLFDFSDDKMTFIKACYTNCMNQGDYMELTNVFDFSTDQEELKKFIASK